MGAGEARLDKGRIANVIVVALCGWSVVGGPVDARPQGFQTAQQYSQAIRSRSSEIQRKIDEWTLVDGRPCQHETITAANLEASRLEGSVMAAYQMSRDSRQATTIRSIYSRRYTEAAAAQISSQLNLADAYLNAGCLDEADNLYRHIIMTFTGTAYAGVRQRAQIGVDDVRAGRDQRVTQ